MNKSILPIILGMFLLTFVSSMYAGTTYTKDFGSQIVNCSIEGNTYNLDGLTLIWNGTIATISTVINYQPDTFSLSCITSEDVYVEPVVVSSGGGGSRHKNKVTNKTNESNITLEEWNYTPPTEEAPIVNESIDITPVINQTDDNKGKIIVSKEKLMWVIIVFFALVLILTTIVMLLVNYKKNKDDSVYHEEIVNKVIDEAFPKEEIKEEPKKNITSVDDILKLNKK